jgi:hypothetical protein
MDVLLMSTGYQHHTHCRLLSAGYNVTNIAAVYRLSLYCQPLLSYHIGYRYRWPLSLHQPFVTGYCFGADEALLAAECCFTSPLVACGTIKVSFRRFARLIMLGYRYFIVICFLSVVIGATTERHTSHLLLLFMLVHHYNV